jgi:hypothetical protein
LKYSKINDMDTDTPPQIPDTEDMTDAEYAQHAIGQAREADIKAAEERLADAEAALQAMPPHAPGDQVEPTNPPQHPQGPEQTPPPAAQ